MSAESATNPLCAPQPAIPFLDVRPEHVAPAIDQALQVARGALAQFDATPQPVRTWANTLGALEEATLGIEFAMGIVAHVESVATTPEWRAAFNEVQPRVSAFYAGIPLHPGLWKALREYASTPEALALDPTHARLLAKTLAEFRRHGAELPEPAKRQLEATDVELAELTTRFAEHVLDATAAFELLIDDPARLAGLPESAITAAKNSAAEKGYSGFRFTLQEPSYAAVLTYLDDAHLREQVWRAHNTRATEGEHENRTLVSRILELRAAKATLLGYREFADLVLEDRMAHNAATARAFIADLRMSTEKYFARETKQLLEFRRTTEQSAVATLNPWDVAYWAEKQRRALYDYDEELLRPYFAVDSVLAGLFAVLNRLYGVRITPAPDVPTWHPEVRTFVLDDLDGSRLGVFHVDLFPRESKRGGAWMNSLWTATPGGPGPHVGLVCGNLTPPDGDRPALLNHGEVETIFHEFGHLLHHLLTRVSVRSLAGTNVAWDFVELPSQIMENWCWERAALDLFARHHETNEPIPDALFEKMMRARNFRTASATMRQLGFASMDLDLHEQTPSSDQLLARARAAMQPYSPAPLPGDYGLVCGFLHLFSSPVGYAAGYYSYKWAEVLDADAFIEFKRAGVFDRHTGTRFRTAILERGDSADPLQLFRDFTGRDPDVRSLLVRSGLSEEFA